MSNYSENKIIGSTYEAIFWWNRTESLYHKSFSKIGLLKENEKAKKFFIRKVFDTFLKEFAVRRNVAKGYNSVELLFENLFSNDNIIRIQNENKEIVDELSETYAKLEFTNYKQTRSLISKCAFMINPSHFSLLDEYTKISLSKITEKSKISFDNSYSTFISAINDEIINIENFSETYNPILEKFKETDAYVFFKDNPNAFVRRIFDKYLWIERLDDKEVRIEENYGMEDFYELIE